MEYVTGCEMGRSGCPGSMFTGVTYTSTSGATSFRRKRQMPWAVNPSPALNSTGIHSEYSPTFNVSFSEPTKMRACSEPGSGRISNFTRSSPPAFSASGFSGPGIYERQTPFTRSTGTRTPPSRNLSPELRVVHRQKVPWLPFRSGTHMPESNTPENFSGGKVTGTRITELKIPALPSQCQNGVPLRMPLISVLPNGMEYLPIFKCRFGPLISADDRNGR